MARYKLSPNSTRLIKGDVVCVEPHTGYVTKALPPALGRARAVVGVSTQVAAPGAMVTIAETGIVRNSVVGLPPGPPATVAVNEFARCIRSMTPHGGEHVVGICDDEGNVTLQPASEVGTGSPHYFNVRAYGAVGNGLTPDDDAFDRALQAMVDLGGTTGATLFIPPGTYVLLRPLVIRRTCVLLGAGGHMEAPASILLFDAGVNGIELKGFGTGGERADSTQIRNLAIFAMYQEGDANGIVANSRFHLENVSISGFKDIGISVYGNMSSGSNANNWYIANCRVSLCGSHGLYLDGPDSNAGVAIMLDCSDNGGWGIYDSSFLGNTFVACHCSSNRSGPYRTDNPNQRSLFLGCYAEEGGTPSEIQLRSIVVGGLHGPGVTGGGLRVHADTNASSGVISPFEVPVLSSDGECTLFVGSSDPVGATILSIRLPHDVSPAQHFKYVNAMNYPRSRGPWAGFNWAHLDRGWSFMLPLDGNRSMISEGQSALGDEIKKSAGPYIAFPSGGFRWGTRFNLFKLLARQDGMPPGDDDGTFEPGDILFNSFAYEEKSKSDWRGWIGAICSVGGTSGTYHEGRTATANGSKVVELNAPSPVLEDPSMVGTFITIDSTEVRILSVTGTTMVVTGNVPSGSGLPIQFKNPTFRKFGELQ